MYQILGDISASFSHQQMDMLFSKFQAAKSRPVPDTLLLLELCRRLAFSDKQVSRMMCLYLCRRCAAGCFIIWVRHHHWGSMRPSGHPVLSCACLATHITSETNPQHLNASVCPLTKAGHLTERLLNFVWDEVCPSAAPPELVASGALEHVLRDYWLGGHDCLPQYLDRCMACLQQHINVYPSLVLLRSIINVYPSQTQVRQRQHPCGVECNWPGFLSLVLAGECVMHCAW